MFLEKILTHTLKEHGGFIILYDGLDECAHVAQPTLTINLPHHIHVSLCLFWDVGGICCTFEIMTD